VVTERDQRVLVVAGGAVVAEWAAGVAWGKDKAEACAERAELAGALERRDHRFFQEPPR